MTERLRKTNFGIEVTQNILKILKGTFLQILKDLLELEFKLLLRGCGQPAADLNFE